MKATLRALVAQAIDALRAAGTLPADLATPEFVIERPKSHAQGDFSTNAAMLLAKPAKSNPRAIAQALVDALPASAELAKVEIAGPGFINFHVAEGAWRRRIGEVFAQGAAYGRNASGKGHRAGVEFVSANPTGPLHVGHGRAAVIGDCIARVLEANGWDVAREFYYNDAGAQINNLAISVQARAQGKGPDDAGWPEDGYRGDYIKDVAQAYLEGASVEVDGHVVTGAKDPDDLDAIRRFAVAYLRREQNLDLEAYGVSFDVYFLESSLYTRRQGRGDRERAGQARPHVRRRRCALAAQHRLLRRQGPRDAQVRRHLHLLRARRRLPPVEVAARLRARDHRTGRRPPRQPRRVRAGLQALDCGIPLGWPEYVLHQMVTVMRGGEEVKLSKRAGSYVTLRDLIDEVGRDATRWFLIARKSDSQLTFDIDFARSQSLDNPVYYVQVSHARMCGLVRQLKERGLGFDPDNGLAQPLDLDDLPARELVTTLLRYGDVVETAGRDLEPHQIAAYLLELAQTFQTYYNDHQFLVDDADTRDARMVLALATRQVLANGLELLGVSAPEVM